MYKTCIENFDLYKDGSGRRLFYSVGSKFKESTEKKVLVFHDAHNIFENKYTTYGNSWEIIDILNKYGIEDCLIFGLECSQGIKRLQEYSPVKLNESISKEFSIAKNSEFGRKYIDSLIKNLIPHMEKKFNFNFINTNSIMIGSSMGGVITTYTALEYPNLFNSYLAFSNAFHVNHPHIFSHINDNYNTIGNYYHDVGGRELSESISESADYINGFEFMNNFLRKINAKYYSVFDSDAEHNEIYWKSRLSSILKKYL